MGALNRRWERAQIAVTNSPGFAPLLYPPERMGLLKSYSWRRQETR